MSFVTSEPEMLLVAAGDLAAIGSMMRAQNAAAAGPVTGVVPPAVDAVSALTAAEFAPHGQMYQAVSAQAAAVHELFATAMGAGAGTYAATEAANAAATS
ncbi:MAG TPA: PE family protein [Mycobacterium sp.]|nr:PE family protein [Mycobacterium sp.]